VTVVDLADLDGLVGREIATSDWLVVTQDRIDAFADATGDHQWIHVDTERARAETLFGATIAHGFLTLSLLSAADEDSTGARPSAHMLHHFAWIQSSRAPRNREAP
jgi:acyl dehydratase